MIKQTPRKQLLTLTTNKKPESALKTNKKKIIKIKNIKELKKPGKEIKVD